MNILTPRATSLFEEMRLVAEGILPTPEAPIQMEISQPKKVGRRIRSYEKNNRPAWGAGAALPTSDL